MRLPATRKERRESPIATCRDICAHLAQPLGRTVDSPARTLPSCRMSCDRGDTVTTPPDDQEPSQQLSQESDDPIRAAQRYDRPSGTNQTGHDEPGIRPGSVGPAALRQPQPEAPSTRAQSNAPLILGIIGIVGWFLCGWGAIGSVVVGAIGQRKARELGQSDVLPKVAWIGGLVVIGLDILGFAVWLAQH